jgi:hypothetical protein
VRLTVSRPDTSSPPGTALVQFQVDIAGKTYAVAYPFKAAPTAKEVRTGVDVVVRMFKSTAAMVETNATEEQLRDWTDEAACAAFEAARARVVIEDPYEDVQRVLAEV